ncbi:uncharacterized protein LOC114734767 [Neltuma alba]|uniref:uncharacterized protein LOC114713489 n=1 Tax=Neltuma alba TaxID=207710 RepID=UPI0010A3CE1F|nr:uncharacterized protein LOC114713489 [Prosopis alba]XP_028778242.1 uncharacterized protein LOC114734767 [Prosopis alba]
MVRGKLILISQSGGKFLTNDDGSMSYTGGEAHAVEINHETTFEDLKLKLAELWNLLSKTLSIKYFLPGNRKTLICISNDRDLKRMKEYYVDSITADVFISGTKGFDQESLNMNTRRNDINVAEAVTPVNPSKTKPKTVRKQTASVGTSANRSPNHAVTTNHGAACSNPPCSVSIATDTSSHGRVISDMDASPADAVKKRRRAASRALTANGPSMNAEESKKVMSRKKNKRNHAAAAADNREDQLYLPCNDYSDNLLDVGSDITPGKLAECWKDSITGVGQDFPSVQEFRDALQKYAMAHHFAYRYIKNDTVRARARCVCEDCPWRIFASWVPSDQSFRIKKMEEPHTCGGKSWKSTHPSKNWLVNVVKDRLRDNLHHKTKEIASAIHRDFGIELNYSQVWRAVEEAREQLQGSYKEAYNQLPRLCERMLESNPGSCIKLVTGDDKRFQRLFLSFHALIRGFQAGCRPLLFLDSSSLKSKYHEVLLTATSLDGDDVAFPVALCIVDVENDDNWNWFLEQLKLALPTSQPMTFVSDREKNLKQSVLKVFQNAQHGYSMYHLLDSFKKSLKGPYHGEGRPSLPVNFLSAAHALRLDGFKMFLEQIRKVSTTAYDWVMEVEPEQWASAVFKGERYNHILVNVAELYTMWIDEVREVPIAQKVEALVCKIVELINNRRADSSSWTLRLTPSKEELLQDESLRAQGLKVLFSSDTLFEVHDDSVRVVDIEKWDCSCLRWKATGLPCCHAIAVLNCTHRSVYDYCAKYFTADNFHRVYSESINPVFDYLSMNPASDDLNNEEEAKEETEIETENNVLPPCNSRPYGQNKKDENKTPKKSRKTVTCTKCKGTGHNKATCKEAS